MLRWTCLGLLLVFAGCSSGASSGTVDGGPSSDGSTSPTRDGGGGIDGGPSVGDGGPKEDGAVTEGGGGGGGTKALYPIALGYTWTYDVQAVGGGAVCATGMHDARVVSGPRTVAGKQAYEITSFCAAAGTTQIAPDPKSDEVSVYYNGGWLTFIDPDLTEGHSWPYFNSSYTWHKEASVTVPAGTFTDCWTAKQNVSYTAYLTFCRGVGQVHSYSKDLAGNGWDAKLTKKSF